MMAVTVLRRNPSAVVPNPTLTVAAAAMEMVFCFDAAGSLIAYMLQDWVVRADELFAAGGRG